MECRATKGHSDIRSLGSYPGSSYCPTVESLLGPCWSEYPVLPPSAMVSSGPKLLSGSMSRSMILPWLSLCWYSWFLYPSKAVRIGEDMASHSWPYPWLTVPVWRTGPGAPQGSTVELSLLVQVWVIRPWRLRMRNLAPWSAAWWCGQGKDTLLFLTPHWSVQTVAVMGPWIQP